MTMLHRRALLAALLVLPAAAQAQGTTRLAISGYDPVAYFTVGKPTPGNPEFETTFDGTRYRFASAENRTRFLAEPDRYAPQFAGACAGGVAKGVKIEANPEHFLIVDGRLFVFSGPPGPPPPELTAMLSDAARNWTGLKPQPFK